MMSFANNKRWASADDMFSEFLAACRREFSVVESEHGLTPTEAGRHGYEFTVVYESPTQRVSIHLEYPAPPWVVLEKKSDKRWRRRGLHQLWKRLHGQAIPVASADQAKPIMDFDDLAIQAELLRDEWEGLFSVL